jgi:hypothetical protein
MKNWILVFGLFFQVFLVEATHIVGGGFSYSRISGNQYRFSLTLYFDAINGNQGALDSEVLCHIFRKFDNNYMDTIRLPLVSDTDYLTYTNPDCGALANVSTRVLEYSTVKTLPDNIYNSSKGYYMIWERCCRNNIITNIQFPEEAGQTFYMEFPPVFRSGQPYINSSPQFLPILADFPCINQDYSISFQAIDSDGDQLVYSMTAPLKGNSSSVTPINISPLPAPYDSVQWVPGFNSTLSIPGNPGLKVNPQTGILTCKASISGLFVFSVKCEEFRNGFKIGEIRREMQLPVVDCPPNDPPDIVLSNPQGIRLGDDDTLVLETKEENFCIPLKLTDIQANTNLKFNLDVISGPSNLESFNEYLIFTGTDSASASFCLPACSVTPDDEYWKIRLRATDNGCPESFSDTLQVFLQINKTPLENPEINFVNSLPDTLVLNQRDIKRYPIIASQEQDAIIQLESRLLNSNKLPLTNVIGAVLPGGIGYGRLDTAIRFSGLCNLPPDGIMILESIVTTRRCGDTLRDTLIQVFSIIPDEPNLTLTSGWTGPELIRLNEKDSVRFTVAAKMSDQSQVILKSAGSLTFRDNFGFSTRGSNDGTVFGDFSFFSTCDLFQFFLNL